MKKLCFFMGFVFLPWLLFGQEVVEKIIIEGNDRVTPETILYYLSSREGDYFNADLLRRDFRVLWSTGFFSDIRIEENDGTSGKVVKIIVQENAVIKEIVYKTGKKLKENDIVNKLKEKDEYILPYSYHSPSKVQRIEETIRDLLLEKGLASATVRTEVEKKGQNEVQVTFHINEGSKIKVGGIEFVGSPKLLQSTLLSAFKENKKHGLISWITGKDSFKRNKLEEDLANLKKKYQEHGFMEAVIGEPRIEEVTKRSIFFRKQAMKKIIVPVEAGYRYFTGKISVEGNKIFNTQGLLSLVKLDEGRIYGTKNREKAVEEIRKLYMGFGYIYAQIIPVESLDPKNKRVNVTFNIHEGELAFLHRLEIKGNTYTKDKVIRRELLLREGDPFRFELFKNSVLRMKQLGLVELEKDPDINPNPQDQTQIDVTLNVQELQRNNIQFTAGYSGYYGTFVSASYETVNFLGTGENLQIMLQYGKRLKNYMFSFTEPYVFDLPLNLGFSIYDRYLVYPYMFNQKSKGIDFNFGARVKGYWSSNLVYSLQYIDVEVPETNETDPYYDPYGLGYNPYFYTTMFGEGRYNMSSIYGSLYRNTVDSPLTPSSGTLYLVSAKFAGGILGGDITLIKPRFEWTFYHPLIKRNVIGLHLEYQFVKSLGDSQIPFWERFFLGGERSIRGYNIYTIGPRNETGVNIGGEKSLVFNAEYIVPLGGPLYAILFYDAGNAYAPGARLNLRDLYTSSGLEMRIFVPALRVPFRLIFSYNNRLIYKDDSNFAFRFAIGTTF